MPANVLRTGGRSAGLGSLAESLSSGAGAPHEEGDEPDQRGDDGQDEEPLDDETQTDKQRDDQGKDDQESHSFTSSFATCGCFSPECQACKRRSWPDTGRRRICPVAPPSKKLRRSVSCPARPRGRPWWLNRHRRGERALRVLRHSVLEPRPFRSCRLRRHNPNARLRSGVVTSVPSSTRGPATVTKRSAFRSRFEPGACRGRPGYPSRMTRARWLRSKLWRPSCWLAAGSECAARRGRVVRASLSPSGGGPGLELEAAGTAEPCFLDCGSGYKLVGGARSA